MKIITKFNFNQRVWIIDECCSRWTVICNYKIIGVHIEKDNLGAADFIDYELDRKNGHVLVYSENLCFATKEKAQKECNRRNKMTKLLQLKEEK